jgi:hypothetical protein
LDAAGNFFKAGVFTDAYKANSVVGEGVRGSVGFSSIVWVVFEKGF